MVLNSDNIYFVHYGGGTIFKSQEFWTFCVIET